MDYLVLTDTDKLQIVRDRLFAVEQDYYRTSVDPSVLGPTAPGQEDAAKARLDSLEAQATELQAQFKALTPDPPKKTAAKKTAASE